MAVLAAVVVGATAGTARAGTALIVTGHGWGHGVGMSQWGAYGYALHGWKYRRILAHYYPGTKLRREGDCACASCSRRARPPSPSAARRRWS